MTSTANTTGRRASTAGVSYWQGAHRPLQMLVFLAPLIIAYELGLISVLSSESGIYTNKAHASLLALFDAFGIAPAVGFLVVVVLLIWHVLNRDPWTIRWGVVGGMAVESIVLVLPLLVMGQLIGDALTAPGAGGAWTLEDLTLWQRIAISIGAGVYEELVFRMLLIAVLHTLFVDVLKATPWIGAVIAVAVSAAAFTWYHDLEGANGHVSARKVAFFAAAGVYFGVLYVTRGFGVAVGVHAAYDVVTVLSLPGSTPG